MSATVRPSPTRPPAARPASSRPGRGPRRDGTDGPRPQALAALLVGVWLEVRAGLRPLRQLEPLVTPVVYRRLARQMPGVRGLAPPARVSRVRACTPAAGVCEAAVTVTANGRTTAIAVRLERHLGRWRAVELTAPEAGLAALTTGTLPPGWRPRDAFDEVLDDIAGIAEVRPRRVRGTS
ncbi:MAG TPA: Rv3235 family protein [Egicoccus sp.]|nr:Rv3235 family protein [Egicoccus sp.]HSK25146.1 Rv3235 family protein [Egicoccus sp.]